MTDELMNVTCNQPGRGPNAGVACGATIVVCATCRERGDYYLVCPRHSEEHTCGEPPTITPLERPGAYDSIFALAPRRHDPMPYEPSVMDRWEVLWMLEKEYGQRRSAYGTRGDTQHSGRKWS